VSHEPIHMSHTRGFTLLELLVVITIAALILTVVAVRFDLWGRGVAVTTATQQLASVMRRAHARAALEGRTVEMHIDPQRSRYWLSGQPRAYTLSGGLRIEPVQSQRAAAARVNERLLVRFYPSGTATGIELRISDGQAAYRLEVSGLTGRVSMRRTAALEEAPR